MWIDLIGFMAAFLSTAAFVPQAYKISKEMAEKDLLPQIRQAEENTILIADGTSCRSQIVDLANKNAVHVACLLDKQLTEN